jgi:hypothetical protein
LREARRRRAEKFYACGALEQFRAARSTRTLGVTMSRAAGFCASVPMLCCAVVAAADVPEFPLSFDCDAPRGHYSKSTFELDSQSMSLNGTIEILEPRHHIRWQPQASVFLMGDMNEERSGLKLYMVRADSTLLHVAVIDMKKPGRSEKFASYPWDQTPLTTPFTLNLTSAGEVTVSVGGRSAMPRSIDFTPKTVVLSCSNAQVKFKDVRLTSSGDT